MVEKRARLYNKATDVIQVLIFFFGAKYGANIRLLRRILFLSFDVRRIPADVRLPALILEIDLGLIERCVKQIIGVMFNAGSGRWADAEPVEPQRVAAGDPVLGIERQELGQCLLLA